MAKLNKWIFGALGWAFTGVIGGLFGFLLGSFFDYATKNNIDTQTTGKTTAGDFRLSFLALFAAVMKADYRNKKVELDFIRNILLNSFGTRYTEQSLPILRELLKTDIPVQKICYEIRTRMNYSERVELINLLIALCLIDNEFHENELELMKKISTWLGINPKDFQSMHSIHIPDNDWAYKVLEVSPTATNDELKKAYRRMAVKYHPDKVAHLDSSVVNAANEKFKVLNEAWEKIKEERNIT